MKLSPTAQRRLASAIPYLTLALAALMAVVLTWSVVHAR
jgi:hypothetical protein